MLLLDLLITFLLSYSGQLSTHIQDPEYPVTWHIYAKSGNNNSHQIMFEAYISDGWVIYGINSPDGGPIATSFTFESNDHINLIGHVNEITPPQVQFEPLFDTEVLKFSQKAVFSQEVKQQGKSNIVNGRIKYMACDGSRCLPPTDVSFWALLK